MVDSKDFKIIEGIISEEEREIMAFEDQIAQIEYELHSEEKLIAKLHNTTRMINQAIKYMHIIFKKAEKNHEITDSNKNAVRNYISKIALNLINVSETLEELKNHETIRKEAIDYCERLYEIIETKLYDIKHQFSKYH